MLLILPQVLPPLLDRDAGAWGAAWCALTLYRSWLMKMMVQSHLLAWLATLRSATLIRRAWLPICVAHTHTRAE